MRMQPEKERGAILIMTAIFSVVLIGIAALALDAGRLFVQHSEMQNAADAAALAAAAISESLHEITSAAVSEASEAVSIVS